MGEDCLAKRFPRVYLNSTQKDLVVGEIDVWVDGGWVRKLGWRRNWFTWEEPIVDDLNQILQRVMLSQEREDRLIWKAASS